MSAIDLFIGIFCVVFAVRINAVIVLLTEPLSAKYSWKNYENSGLNHLKDSLTGFDKKVFEMENHVDNFTDKQAEKWSMKHYKQQYNLWIQNHPKTLRKSKRIVV